MIDEQELERRLRSTLRRKAGQVGGPALLAVEPSVRRRRRRRRRPAGLVVALVGMAAALFVVVLVARTGAEPDRVVTAETVPGAPDAPLSAWLPPGMDVWSVSSAQKAQASVVVLGERGSDRRIEIVVRDAERTDPDAMTEAVALTGVDPAWAQTSPLAPHVTVIPWSDAAHSFQAIGRDVDPGELAALLDQVSLVREGEGYISTATPAAWGLVETRREPPATTTSAEFFVGVPDGSEPDLVVTQSIADAPGDGTGWTSAAAYVAPDAEGRVWFLPGDLGDSSVVGVIDRAGQAVTVRSTGTDPLSVDELRALALQVVDGPRDQLTRLRARARANVSATPVVATTTTEGGETIELHGTDDGRASAVCVTRLGTTTCRPAGTGVVDLVTVTTADGDGTTTVYGATRDEPSFTASELRGEPWVVEADGWHFFRIEPVALGATVTAGDRGVVTPYVPDSP